MKYKCSFCKYQTDDIVACGKHYEMMHKSLLPPKMSGEQFAYYVLTGRPHGRCVVCHNPTKWNFTTHKYQRICSAKCKREYGKIKQLTNPKVQQEMLSHRKISGEYQWSTSDDTGNRPTFSYTGSYEQDFLRYMDLKKHWNPNDLLMPCPHIFEYYYDNQKRFYIPDAYIPSLDLVIEIKDGDPSNPDHHANGHPEIQAVNRVKEKLKKQAVKKTDHKYIVIYNKDYSNFELYVRTQKNQYLTEDLNAVANMMNDRLSEDIITIFTKLVHRWEKYVKEHELEDWVETSKRLNQIVLNAMDTESFEKAMRAGLRKTIIEDLLKITDDGVDLVFSIMDSDSELKIRMHDPYLTQSMEYTSAKKQLLKWKHPREHVYLGKYVDYDFDDEADTVRLNIAFTPPDD